MCANSGDSSDLCSPTHSPIMHCRQPKCIAASEKHPASLWRAYGGQGRSRVTAPQLTESANCRRVAETPRCGAGSSLQNIGSQHGF